MTLPDSLFGRRPVRAMHKQPSDQPRDEKKDWQGTIMIHGLAHRKFLWLLYFIGNLDLANSRTYKRTNERRRGESLAHSLTTHSILTTRTKSISTSLSWAGYCREVYNRVGLFTIRRIAWCCLSTSTYLQALWDFIFIFIFFFRLFFFPFSKHHRRHRKTETQGAKGT